MSWFDHTKGAMDAEFIGHMTGGGNLGTLKAMRERMDQLADNAWAWKDHAEKVAARLEETERKLSQSERKRAVAVSRYAQLKYLKPRLEELGAILYSRKR